MPASVSALARLPETPDPPMSTAEFLCWEPGDGGAWQLVDGEPRAMVPASQVHGLLQGELARVIGNHLRETRSPCRVVVAPGVVPRVRAADNVRIPDLAVRCTPPRPGEAVMDAPLLVAEILSPSNRAETWANVWTYTTIPGLNEILVLHAASIRADVLRRGADGTWPEEPEKAMDGDLVLDSIGLRTPLAALYDGTGVLPA